MSKLYTIAHNYACSIKSIANGQLNVIQLIGTITNISRNIEILSGYVSIFESRVIDNSKKSEFAGQIFIEQLIFHFMTDMNDWSLVCEITYDLIGWSLGQLVFKLQSD